MENTARDNEEFRMPDKMTVYPPSGEPFTETESQFQLRLAENRARTQALIREVDNYWQWLVEAEPIKLTNELAVEDLMSAIVGHLVDERKVVGADIMSAVKRCVQEHRE